MKCQYCNEWEGKFLIKFDKNCEPAWMCKRCADNFKPINEIIVGADLKDFAKSEGKK